MTPTSHVCPKCAKMFSQVGRCPNKWKTPKGEAQCEGVLVEFSFAEKAKLHLYWQERWDKLGLRPFEEERA